MGTAVNVETGEIIDVGTRHSKRSATVANKQELQSKLKDAMVKRVCSLIFSIVTVVDFLAARPLLQNAQKFLFDPKHRMNSFAKRWKWKRKTPLPYESFSLKKKKRRTEPK
jgi:hypothetical protein